MQETQYITDTADPNVRQDVTATSDPDVREKNVIATADPV